MPTQSVARQSTAPVPIEYAGKWVAWNSDHSHIVAHSDRLQEVWRIVRDLRIPDPVFEKVPRADVRFVIAQQPREKPKEIEAADL